MLTEKNVDRAATLRQGPWFLCLSAYTAPLERDRWHQDRQNLVSIWHDKAGLVLGGGNTKLQPAWSSFTVGQMDLLRQQPGDTNPNFLPTGQLYHVPSEAQLIRERQAGLDLTYGPETCRIRVRPRDERRLEYRVEASARSDLPIFAHVTLLPRLGTALVAGFSTINRGWDGGHKVSGRPGYAWYFGRDAEWSGFAIDDYGDFATVRRQLEFLERYQDMSGKIFHELSTSGVVHYDASDATPLYILLAAHYVRASGDVAYLRKSWPHLQKAMEFLYSTDPDGDQLIEDTNVGHGWLEPGGKLFPVHTEFYLAGIWGEALARAAWTSACPSWRRGCWSMPPRICRMSCSHQRWISMPMCR